MLLLPIGERRVALISVTTPLLHCRFAFYSLFSNSRGILPKIDMVDTLLFTPFDPGSKHATLLSRPKVGSTVQDSLVPFAQIKDTVLESFKVSSSSSCSAVCRCAGGNLLHEPMGQAVAYMGEG